MLPRPPAPFRLRTYRYQLRSLTLSKYSQLLKMNAARVVKAIYVKSRFVYIYIYEHIEVAENAQN
jgi:hypothetical protein